MARTIKVDNALLKRFSYTKKKRKNREAKSNKINCAWSNEAFELWYLLHFQYRNTGMQRNEYKKAIEDAINEQSKSKKKCFKYHKNAVDMYDILQRFGNQEQAIVRAKKLIQNYKGCQFAEYNPATTVYELVEELIGKSMKLKEEIMKNFEK